MAGAAIKAGSMPSSWRFEGLQEALDWWALEWYRRQDAQLAASLAIELRPLVLCLDAFVHRTASKY